MASWLGKLRQAGDQRAFEVLVHRYSRRLASFIGSILKDDDQLADVLQHVFLQLYLSLPTLLTTVPLNGWLLRVAHNRCLDELRRRRRRAEIAFSSLAWDAGEEEYSPIEAIPAPGGHSRAMRAVLAAAAGGSGFSAARASPDYPPVLFQTTDLRGNQSPAQYAGDDREDVLLPLTLALALRKR